MGLLGAFGRYQEIVHHGVLLEEDGWVREEEEQTMRCKEDKKDAKSRERRGGTVIEQWGSPMLGVVRRNRRRRKVRGNLESGGHAGATIMPAFETLSRILSSAKTFP
jgi:hypothetical protein